MFYKKAVHAQSQHACTCPMVPKVVLCMQATLNHAHSFTCFLLCNVSHFQVGSHMPLKRSLSKEPSPAEADKIVIE